MRKRRWKKLRKIKGSMYFEEPEIIAFELLYPSMKEKLENGINVIEVRRWYSSSPSIMGVINMNGKPIALYEEDGWADDINYSHNVTIYEFSPHSILRHTLVHLDLPEEDPMNYLSYGLKKDLEEFMGTYLSSKGNAKKIEIDYFKKPWTKHYSYWGYEKVSEDLKKYLKEDLSENLEKMIEGSRSEKIWEGKKNAHSFEGYFRYFTDHSPSSSTEVRVLKRNIEYVKKGKDIFKTFHGNLKFIPDKIKYDAYQTVSQVFDVLKAYTFFHEKTDVPVTIRCKDEKRAYDIILSAEILDWKLTFDRGYKGSYTRKVSKDETKDEFVKELLEGESFYEFNFPEM